MSEPVDGAMREVICARLEQISQKEGARILFAVESGSRAWGFHSPDSDYDVRFLYARPVDWHLRLDKRRDVIEYPIDDELDISGWELGKALKLAIGSNAVVAEWLQSPIVYQSDPDAVQVLTSFARAALDRKSVTWHYRALLLRQNGRLAHPDGGIRIKRYFYVLRPALALRWMRLNDAAMPPMNLYGLVDGCALGAEQTEALDRLVVQKKKVGERATAAQSVPVLDQLVASELQLAEAWLKAHSGARSTDQLWNRAHDIHAQLSRQAGR
ncbi:hypothetical protein ACMU_02375 [Actibacterium mucosum KCTC 23349]|uniref:Nucleotidyltransferase n=1 Tax=Actibacterium mucosum KCTC 23349 TaxID=1454373 RepID=A0A037ZP90_9RHOB|nr:nucleotidyltransferase domain-containing protein [Actibacterium mucosum]KAJ57368.1 hypothetical protein ACMU_02375 [Actibacterium mucosum KCTC 23349]